jgi:uncharacterized membrane protein HdeD (DUF308 family)
MDTIGNSTKGSIKAATKLPRIIIAHGVILAVVLLWYLLSGIASVVGEYGESSALGDLIVIRIAIIAIVALILLVIYSQLLRRKNWARVLLGILTLPVGLMLFSDEARRYCLGDVGPGH